MVDAMRVWVAVLLAAGVLSGCVGLPRGQGCDDGLPPATVRTPWIDGGFLRTDPEQGWDTLVLADGTLSASAPAQGWSVESERFSAPGEANFSALRVTPGKDMGHLALAYQLSDCEGTHAGTISWDLAEPRMGTSAEPGQGVHVLTAGFWENGTLFYTNIAAIDQGDWPRAGWYAWEGDEPLPVYVYDQDRSEQPDLWHDPQAGTPVEGTVPGLGYVTTIPGFNDALKGLSTNTVRVVRLAPEDAYTRAGNEEHPLYGDALVFYIKVLDVVDAPCPAETGKLCGLTTVDFRH